MKGAPEFEKAYRRLPVKVLDHEGTNGVLNLDGPESVLQTSGVDFHLRQPKDENGWFNLRVAGPDGKAMLLHNAILLSAASHHWHDDKRASHSAEIYPNAVIDDIRGLDSNGRVQRAIFRITDFHNFFYFKHTETLFKYSGTEEQLSFLRAMQSDDSEIDGLFDPQNIYIVHNFPRYFVFKIENRTYEVYAGARQKFGIHKISYEALPTAAITFDDPVEFEEAIGHVFAWRRLFSQLAMMPLAIEEISVQASNSEMAPLADVYLTNSAHKRWSTKGYYSLSPREQPFNEWGSREKLGKAHKAWLEKEPSRRRFRISLDKVIEELSERSAASQLVELSAGIESLEEFRKANDFPAKVIREMAKAAQKVSDEQNHSVPLDRIVGLLGAIARPSLAHRITALGSKAATKSTDIELICKAAVRVRNLSAHGGETAGQKLPIVSPTVQALAALCAQFDLETSGLSGRFAVTNLMSATWMRDSVEELKRYLTPD